MVGEIGQVAVVKVLLEYGGDLYAKNNVSFINNHSLIIINYDIYRKVKLHWMYQDKDICQIFFVWK